MAFRARRGNYIKIKNGRYYYRRAIPVFSRRDFDGKTEWVISLKGQNDTERHREAQELAARHDRQLASLEDVWESPDDGPLVPAETVEARFNFAPEDSPAEAGYLRLYRNGLTEEFTKVAITDDPARLRRAAQDGYFAMSQDEATLQYELEALRIKFEDAETDDARELTDLKAAGIAAKIDRIAASAASETVRSVLEPWRANRRQALTTWKKHDQYSREFTDLHGDLPLIEVNKRHVVQYVEHAQKMTYQGNPISPSSIAKRLDSIKALFAYAVAVDLIPSSPATGVKPPRDTRPKTSQSWKSFDKGEIQNLVSVATDIWTNRRASRNEGRKNDLITALHCLIWTAARPEEICQLRRRDIDLSRGAIVITNDDSDDGSRAKLIKNERSTREIPIHSRLLPTLEQHMRRSNSPLLFPSFEPQPSRAELDTAKTTGQAVEIKGRYARPISREWTDYLREKVVPNESRKVLYSLRHSWAAESRRIGMPENVRNAIMGHANDNQHASRYGGDADWLEEKRRHIELMDCIK